MLTVEAIDAGYGPVQVLRALSLEVRAGEVLCLMGRNGAGKSTTLKAIMGLVEVSAGRLALDDVPVSGLPTHQVPKHGIGYVPQGRRLFGDLTVAENIEIGLLTRRRGQRVRDHVLDLFPRLRERMGQVSRTLSGGEQQMLAIARGLLSKPRLLMLDEPSMGVAPILKDFIFDTLRDIRDREQLTLLIVEQDADIALGIADTGYVIETGRIVMQGPAAELADNEDVRRAYLGG